MGRFGWHSGVVKANSYAYAANATPKYGVDLTNVTPGGADIKLTNDAAILTNAGVPTDGTSGTGVGAAGPGSLCIDITNSNHYINAGTKASPTWKLVTRAA